MFGLLKTKVKVYFYHLFILALVMLCCFFLMYKDIKRIEGNVLNLRTKCNQLETQVLTNGSPLPVDDNIMDKMMYSNMEDNDVDGDDVDEDVVDEDVVDGDVVDGNNEVIIYNFKTKQYSNYLPNSLIAADVKTITGGQSEIFKNGDLYVEDHNYARKVYFNSDGSLRWQYINRAINGKLYQVGNSRIMTSENELKNVRKFLNQKSICND